MTELIRSIACALVDEPDQVRVTSVPENGGETIELRVAERDLGRVIGRQGRTARSLRAILTAAAAKHNRRCSLEIVE